MSTQHFTRPRTAVAVAAVVSIAALVLPATGTASAIGAAAKSGTCSTLGTWNMKAKGEAPRMIGVEFSVDTNVPGQSFQVRLFHNGTQLVNAVRTTRRPSGSFTVSRVVPNTAGVDRFRAHATRVMGANTCAAGIRF